MNLKEKFEKITYYNRIIWGEIQEQPIEEESQIEEEPSPFEFEFEEEPKAPSEPTAEEEKPKDTLDITLDVLKKLFPTKEEKTFTASNPPSSGSPPDTARRGR
ncbi:MAG: hypothetical protein GXN92_01360, partial [Candidatus Micrarchaeota archaeon]|nr:hypothetical protein [Candidatus Micrarchaeota archaeon]